MTRERALEIVAAYGADVARWPEGERAAVLALAAEDAALKAAVDEARGLDAMFVGWALDVPVKAFDADALVPVRPSAAARARFGVGFRRLVGGGAVAAALATVLVLTVPASNIAGDMVGVSPVVYPAQDRALDSISLGSASEQARVTDDFALIFTPTADEEDLI